MMSATLPLTENPRPRLDRRPRVLVVLAHPGFFRNYERALFRMVREGAEVHLLFTKVHKSISLADYAIPEDVALHLTLLEPVDEVRGEQQEAVERSRVWRDVLHYAQPEFQNAHDLQSRFHEHQKGLISSSSLLIVKSIAAAMPEWVRANLQKRLEDRDLSVPEPAAIGNLMEEVAPDLVITAPLINFFSREVDFVKAAKRRGIRTMLPVASWDNLTNKGIMKLRPDVVTVWNKGMAREAMRLHGVRKSALRITGATVFDWWFDWRASCDRGAFCARFGFDPRRPILLYLCSSHSIGGSSERAIFERWLQAVRACPETADAGVLVRPHPMAPETWKGFDPEEGRRLGYCVYPLNPKHPTTDESRTSFYDAMHHAAAVVGLNTSAMIEAAILRRPVLTFTDHDAADTQTGNLHFAHLTASGVIRVGTTLDGHIDQLAGVITDRPRIAKACDKFITRFVRPLGRDVEASEVLAQIAIGEARAAAAARAAAMPR